MASSAQILNIVNLLSSGSEGLGLGKSSTAKTDKKDFIALLKSLTSKAELKNKKLTSNVLKEEVPVILPFSFPEVKTLAGKTKRLAGGTIQKQINANVETPKDGIGPQNNLIATITGKNKAGAQKDIKNIFSTGVNKITNFNVISKTLKSAEKNGISKIEVVKNGKIVQSPLKAANGLGIKSIDEKDVKIEKMQPKPLKAAEKGSHNIISLGTGKNVVLNKVSPVQSSKKVAEKSDRNLLAGQSNNKQITVNSSADVKKVNITPKLYSELKISAELLPVKDSELKKESYFNSRKDNIKSEPLIRKIERSAARLIANKSVDSTLLNPKAADSGVKLKTDIVLRNSASVEKSASDEITPATQNRQGNVDVFKQKNSILIRGVRNSVIYNMQPVAAESIGNKINILQSSAKRVISESNKREIPTLSFLKASKNTKQEMSNKSVEKNYNNLLNFSNKKSNTLLDSDTKNLFNAQMGITKEDTSLPKLKTTFVKNGVLLDQTKLLDNNLMKFTIKEIDKGLSQIQLRITPKGLGSIKIDLQQDGNVLVAKFFVETPEIAKLLKDALPELKEALSQQGIKLDESEVSSRKEESAHYFNGKNTGNFEGKYQKNNSHRTPVINHEMEVPLEVLSQKQTLIHSPNSTIEYLA